MKRNTFFRVWVAALLAVVVVVASSSAAASAAPPIQQFAPYSIVGADGKPVAEVMLTPGPAVDTWAMIFNGKAVWQLSPIGKSVPPPPPPPPPPPVKPVAVYFIHESGDLNSKEAAVRDGLAWKKTAEAAGIRWLCFDKDSGVKKFPDATKRATAAGLPAVVFIDAKGVPDVVKAPATAVEMESLVKQKGGAK